MVNKEDQPAEPKRIQSLQRAMAVIEAIAASEDGMRLQDLARQVDLTPGAVHHIVDTLVAGRWLVRTTQPVRYRLGSALVGMGGRQELRRLIGIADAEMVALLARCGGGSISFCEAAGNEILLTRMVHADRPAVVVPVTGTVLPPYTSAASGVHLAFWPAERAQAYRELRPFEVHAGGMWGGAERFDAALVQARAAGYIDLPLSGNSLRIGVPVLGAGGALLASLTITAEKVADPATVRARLIAEGVRTTAIIRARLEGADHG
jgi:IclR family acetate operon transcriptional repressor